MKILTFIKNIIQSKPKITYPPVPELVFPELKNGEYALLRADRNTGIILTDQFERARYDKTTVYEKTSDLNTAVNMARAIVKARPSVEVCIYNHKDQWVYLIDVQEEKFNKPDLELNFKLTHQTNRYTQNKLLNFGLAICKRLLPVYIHFHNVHQWGDPSALTEAINYCESHSIAEMQTDKLQDYHRRIEAVTPDTKDFGDYNGSYALNAACSVMSLLNFLISGDKESILEISTYLRDTIDFKLAEANPDLTDEEIDEHPDMIREWKYQLELLKFKA